MPATCRLSGNKGKKMKVSILCLSTTNSTQSGSALDGRWRRRDLGCQHACEAEGKEAVCSGLGHEALTGTHRLDLVVQILLGR